MEYLKGREVEVAGMMFALFDQEWETKIYGEEQREEGRAEGRAEGRLSLLVSLVKDGIISLAEAAKRAGVSEQEFSRSMAQLA